MAMVELTGEIVPNDLDWVYDWFGIEHTPVNRIKDAVSKLPEGETLEVRINSPGGDVASGQEIYSLLQTVPSVAKVMGMAASAAGLAAMGCRRVEMSPVSTLMVHNVWTMTSGDYHEMDAASRMLKQLNKSIAAAFVTKSGMDEESVLKMMDKETWITANQAVELGLCDAIIGEPEGTPGRYSNSLFGMSITPEMIEQAKAAKAEEEQKDRTRAKEIVGDLDLFGI